MSVAAWLLAHHAVALLLALGFAGSVLRQRRPAGSAFAWLLIIFLVPLVGIPLYLSFGARKLPGKPPLDTRGFEALHARSLTWLDDGVLAFRAFLEQIERAKRSIRIITFVLGNDPAGTALLAALAAKAEQGVEVEILIDDLLRREAPRRELKRLERAGGQVARFMPLLHLPFRGVNNLRNHRKIAVFDGERAIVGGMNLADEYLGPEPSPKRWRDLSLLLEGAPAVALDSIFRADWQFARKVALKPAPASLVIEAARQGPRPQPPSPVAPDIPLQLIPSGPDGPSDPLYDALVTALFGARRRFWVATPYFIPDETLQRGLLVAARRGVDVRIVVPDRSNHRLADIAGAPYLRELSGSGVHICRYMPGMLHAKAVLADDSLAITGSANFDMRSLFLNFEIALLLPGAGEVARLAAWFESLFPQTREGMPPASRLRKPFEDVARLFAPLL